MLDTKTVDVDEMVARYFAAWNASESERLGAVDMAFTKDAYYCDGAAEAAGLEQISAMMNGVMTQFDGARFQLASPIDTHHQQARFEWKMLNAEDAVLVDGIDAVRFNDTGRISAALGFFGVSIPDGQGSTTAHTFEWERGYDVPADRLFALVSDLDVYAEVAPNLASIEVLEGDGVGTVRRCTNPDGESWIETYTEWVPGQRFVTAVDVSTYPPSLAAMIHALEMSVNVVATSETTSTVRIEIATELSETGVQVLRDGGAADGLFQPILTGWAERLNR